MQELPRLYDQNGKEIELLDVLQPFWLWLVREAKVNVIDALDFIEVEGLDKEVTPVISFKELVGYYKNHKAPTE